MADTDTNIHLAYTNLRQMSALGDDAGVAVVACVDLDLILRDYDRLRTRLLAS